GSVRVLAPLTHTLAETPAWTAQLAPLAEAVAKLLAGDNGDRPGARPPTPLTQANRSAGRDQQRRRPKQEKTQQPPGPTACRSCGGELSNPGRGYCEACLPGQRSQHLESLMQRGPAALARLRAAGADPSHGGAAREKRAAIAAERRHAVLA